ncbi:hypothetical protein A2291_03995 [candidate division WOR-1 bacterium RIFOXYB2_FULL_42_35]|uniref:NodB homology domain-containing protein n=1 Tax=candidate division WOR-1 bacterium RIFOXYC2_FULL_41_25 TaxID=1802586 RepID=A0A1F4TMT1_UNCSA|nr:MAG: hypothetical protein A2247_00835 [candidate division WOR-1 bacterium RIFOXYA2_FULL_41_14]OGC24294.1 MAG: hypothetical protein A2291_03995 [candidate division WOR-1 bacterium RIFOXYB2_FULL_42_35]OGC33996.1 MAG: hypothetical protein A2462_01400 [candidate division WOR-1 bacterium RIFOXYC2_FULL_41_25]OGC43148.1 MAG: hypothetical protein A2548_01775 [candidate division WOR-1 bacterium RIFOXYD2_FULL_41_8]
MKHKVALLILLFVLLLLNTTAGATIYKLNHPKQVALTFDDGPYPVFTEKVLDILKAENVKATFFVVGKRIEENPQILARISQEGHQIGNHTYNHTKITWINEQKLLLELTKTNALIKELTGQECYLFRPPYGTINKAKIKTLEKAGYKIILWSVNADDYYHLKTGIRKSNSIIKRIISKTKGDDIILMHDKSKETVAALPRIITRLKKQGYKFVVLN